MIRGFPRPAAGIHGCKGFGVWRTDKTTTNQHDDTEIRIFLHTEFTEPIELFLRNEQNICYQMGIKSTEFVADFVTMAGAMGTDDEDVKL